VSVSQAASDIPGERVDAIQALSELLGDVVYRVPPLTTVDAADMVRELRTAPTLLGHHGTPGADGPPGVDIAGIEDLLHRMAQLADAIPQLAPVIFGHVWPRSAPCCARCQGVRRPDCGPT